MYRFLLVSVLFLSIVCNGVSGFTCQSTFDPSGQEKCMSRYPICITLFENNGNVSVQGCTTKAWAERNCGKDGSYCWYCMTENCNKDCGMQKEDRDMSCIRNPEI